MLKVLRITFAILKDLYAALWKNTTGQQWTYIWRLWVKDHPRTSSWLLPAIFLGLLVVARVFGSHFWVVCVCAFVWFLAGHLFWDTAGAYIPTPRCYRHTRKHQKATEKM